MCSGGGKASAQAAGKARDAEDERKHRLDAGMQSINDAYGSKAGFNDAFYDKQSKAYRQYYNPQVKQQYGDAREQILFGLSRAGLLNSSAGAKTFGKLDQDRGLRLNEVASKAQDYANQTRAQVEASKSSVISQLYATQDPAAAARSAVNNANLIATRDNNFSPVADLFQGVTGLVAQRAAAGQFDQTVPPATFNKGYTGSSTGSSSGSGRTVAS